MTSYHLMARVLKEQCLVGDPAGNGEARVISPLKKPYFTE
jgi:hypothetical protein